MNKKYQETWVIINPSSGQEEGKKLAEEIQAKVQEVAEKVVIKETKKAGDATDFAKDAAKKKIPYVIAVGGDGTVNEVCNGLGTFENPPHLGIVPLGTVNDWAQALGIPIDQLKAIENLTSSNLQTVDLGKVNDLFFTNVIALGTIPKAINDTSIEDKSKIGPLAYLKEGLSALLENEEFGVEIKSAEKNYQGKVACVVVLMTSHLGSIANLVSDAKLDDGKCGVLVLEKLGLKEVLDIGPKILTKKIETSDNILYFRTDNVEISGTQVGASVDGDDYEEWPMKVSVLPEKLSVVVP